MERLRRSFRESFRRKKDSNAENSKPHQWQTDEANVRGGTCSFHVKYLGCVEVFESRGMQVCEEALKVLRASRRRPLKGTLYVSGDGLRVVDDDSKGLIVDQTIEKVSFCAPDRYHERGFSYICRDGTTRRWMCHGFLASKDSGERLSHAVGCAFAVCLERKQKRERDPGVPVISNDIGNFKRAASLRSPPPVFERIDPQENKPSEPPPVSKNVVNPHAIARPHAAPHLLARQGSIRGVPLPTQISPFKRQMSLRVNELPSTVERQQRSMSLDAPEFKSPLSGPGSPESPAPPPRVARDRQPSLTGGTMQMTPIYEHSPGDKTEGVAELCQQFSHGLQQLTNNNVPSRVMTNQNQAFHVSPPTISPMTVPARQPTTVSPPVAPRAPSRGEEWLGNIVSQRVTSPTLSRPAPPKPTDKVDPFNADWAVRNQNGVNPNNPFLTADTKVTRTFQVQL